MYAPSKHRVAGREFVTTEFVVVELADALARPHDRPEFLAVRDAIIKDASFHIFPASTELLARGVEFYRERPDKEMVADGLHLIRRDG